MLRKTFYLIFALFNFMFVSGQKIITDTLFIKFTKDSIIGSNYYFDTISDKRDYHSRVLSYSQKKKYLMIPIDQEICLHEPLSCYLRNIPTSYSTDTFALDINYFIVEKYNGRFFYQYRLYADMPLYTVSQGLKEFKGTLVYNYEYQPKLRKTTKDKVVEEMLPRWHQQFKIDMLGINSYLHNGENKPDVFIEKEFKKPYFLDLTVGGVVGFNFWQIEGELYLVRPETNSSNWFISNIIRYQKTTEFETFSYGKKSEHYFKRINEKWNLTISSNLLLGYVKFKQDEDIKLYQLLQGSISSSQCIEYNKLNQSGFLLKAGLFENFYYIVEKPGFQAGIYLSAGYKF